ncbi:DUF624 domain-containing protein [Microbacterium hydrocarbonoxydans]|uniref:DUF624 domain-containing protein n=1 Tax=Microbacterium hydrocarbonoxydans TaxID=273678 RepID=UPI0007BBFE71|nr:DUF624 domain-containing protein [Microbacterium hydrocarbonoxydans]GAT74171.1 flavodoxin reductase (Ferredoxin-NADPH reductase) family 1 [Microbacterium sp. HM58-2]
MKRVSHGTWAAILGVVHLGLMVNLLVLLSALPLMLLLFTTDPALSWPLLVLAAPIAAPALTGAFTAFRESADGETQVVRAFLRGWTATWRKAMLLGLLSTATVVVLLVDVRAVADTAASVVVVPVLGLLTVVAVATALVGLVGLAEAPRARMRDLLRAALYLGVRRWYLTALSFAVLGVQFAVFTTVPAIAVGLTCAPALYVAWANSRHTLRPVLEVEEAAA